MSQNKPYYTLFFVTLKQHSELCTSAAEHSSDVDLPTARNGRDELFIRGTSFTGALLDQARKLGLKIDDDICGTESAANTHDGQKRAAFKSSRVNVFNLYPHSKDPKTIPTIFRQHVAINEKTGAAENGALYDLEVIPSYNEWTCIIEVDMSGLEEANRALSPDSLVATVLEHWKNHYLFLGHRPAAGYGWFKVEKAEILQLTTEQLFDYPNNTQPITQYTSNELAEELGLPLTDPNSLVSKDSAPLVRQLHFEYSLECGPNKDDNGDLWGLDGFFIGGHELEAPQHWQEAGDKLKQQFSTGSNYQLTDSDFPDQFFVKDENNAPFIPSGSIRGVLRHEVLRSHSKQAKTLFGNADGNNAKSSNLFISPARLEQEEHWQALVLHNHAEDEFTAGVYGSSKFCRATIIEGKFYGEIILEYLANPDNPDTLPAEVTDQKNALLAAMDTGVRKQLPIGAKQWVDSGWLKWQYKLLESSDPQDQSTQGAQ